jgi:hypothetical protein
MGRFKGVEIKGLFFEDFYKIFESILIDIIKESPDEINKIEPKMPELLKSYEDSTLDLYIKNHKFKLNEYLNSHFKIQKQIVKNNKLPFIYFNLYLNGCAIIYEKIIEKIPRKRIDKTLRINILLYGLIIRKAFQINDLLTNGHVDGAMIIWRSLYENAITLLVLAIENNNELADKFSEHSTRSSKRKILSYKNTHKQLKFKPLPKSTDKIIEQQVKELTDKYGKDFLENEFGWANDLFPQKQKANLKLLEERVNMERYRPYYILCSEQVHSNFNSLNIFLEKNKYVLPKIIEPEIESVAFIDPMQFTASILQEVIDYILFEFSIETEHELNLALMRKILEQMIDTFE